MRARMDSIEVRKQCEKKKVGKIVIFIPIEGLSGIDIKYDSCTTNY